MKIEHIAMYAVNLEEMRDFFVTYFGAAASDEYQNKDTGFRSYFLSFQDGARLEIMNKPEMQDGEKSLVRTGYIHMALSVGSRERVDEITQILRADGFSVISGPRTTGDGYYESAVIGPEGNQIEITV